MLKVRWVGFCTSTTPRVLARGIRSGMRPSPCSNRRGFAVRAPRRRRRPPGPYGPGASLLVQLQEVGSVSEGHDLGAALPDGASHERPCVGWGVARLVAVRRREGRPDPAPGAGATEKESAISKKRKPSKKQKPSFKAPASPNVASANKPSKKTQPSLKTPNVTSGSESKPSFPAFTDSGERSPEADTYAASLKLGEAPELARCHIRQNSLSAALWANSFAGPRTASFGARRASPSSRWRR